MVLLITQILGVDYFLFERELIKQGQWWRLLSAHIVHSNYIHLLLNMLALALVLILFDSLLRGREWLYLIALSSVLQSIGFYVLLPNVTAYVGLSGVLHTLYVVGALRLLQQPNERIFATILLCLVTLKLLTERLGQGISVTEQMIGGHVLTEAHLFGAIIGLMYEFVAFSIFKIINFNAKQ
ncbi:MAG: rhombosortase [Moraxellaceae bacterium]|nr:rhombosortase [Moraxellaceae bacterium]